MRLVCLVSCQNESFIPSESKRCVVGQKDVSVGYHIFVLMADPSDYGEAGLIKCFILCFLEWLEKVYCRNVMLNYLLVSAWFY